MNTPNAVPHDPTGREELDYHHRDDPHQKGSRLSDIILGGQDGLVNTLGVILGVAAATGDAKVVLVAGLAATCAESISMGACAYSAARAEHAFYESERQREMRHVQHAPTLERNELREIFAAKGVDDQASEQLVALLSENKEAWVALMLSEEHKLRPVEAEHAGRTAFIVGLAALLGALVPLLPFAFLPVGYGIWTSLGVSALTLFATGVYKARATIGAPWKSGFELVLVGMASALAGYGIGWLLKVGLGG